MGNAFCWLLLKKPIPGYVNRLADLGGCCKCLIPRHLLENAPVGGTSNANSNTNQESGFQVYSRPGSRSSNATLSSSQKQAFAGNGTTLGTTDSVSSSSNDTSYVGGIRSKVLTAFQSSTAKQSSSGT